MFDAFLETSPARGRRWPPEVVPRGAQVFRPSPSGSSIADNRRRGVAAAALEVKSCVSDVRVVQEAICQRFSSLLARQILFRRKEVR